MDTCLKCFRSPHILAYVENMFFSQYTFKSMLKYFKNRQFQRICMVIANKHSTKKVFKRQLKNANEWQYKSAFYLVVTF